MSTEFYQIAVTLNFVMQADSPENVIACVNEQLDSMKDTLADHYVTDWSDPEIVPMLTPEEEADLVDQINSNPYLHPLGAIPISRESMEVLVRGIKSILPDTKVVLTPHTVNSFYNRRGYVSTAVCLPDHFSTSFNTLPQAIVDRLRETGRWNRDREEDMVLFITQTAEIMSGTYWLRVGCVEDQPVPGSTWWERLWNRFYL